MNIERFNERIAQIFSNYPNSIIEYIAVLRADNSKIKFTNYIVRKEKVELFCNYLKNNLSTTTIKQEVRIAEIKHVDFLIIK